MIGHKRNTEAMGCAAMRIGRGAFYLSVEAEGVSHGGAGRKANVGISNDKESEKLSRRKTQGS